MTLQIVTEISSDNIRVILPMHVRGQLLIFSWWIRLIWWWWWELTLAIGWIIFIFGDVGKGKGAVQPQVFRGIISILGGRKFISNYNNKCVAYIFCLVFGRGQWFKAEGCQSTGAMQPWLSRATGNWIWHLSLRNLSDQRIKSTRLSLTLMQCLGKWVVVLGILKCMYLGQDNK